MGGIAGIIRFDGKPIASSLIKKMVRAAIFRARKSVDYWYHKKASLAQLNFHPQKKGYQLGPLTVVADVRFDNRNELLKQLKGQLSCPSPSDTELICMAWSQWGERCFEHFRGDFAIALWDNEKQCLRLARDILGSKSLFYCFDGKQCLFASDIRQIFCASDIKPQLNEAKLGEYLMAFRSNKEETFFQQIFACPPSHHLSFNLSQKRHSQYWCPRSITRIKYRNDKQYSEHFFELLSQSVCARMIETKIGISLSGGLDSTLIAAIMATEANKQHLHSFSYVFKELKSCDEKQYIDAVLAYYPDRFKAHFICGDNLWTLKDFEHWPTSPYYIWSDAYAGLPMKLMEKVQAQQCPLFFNGQYGDALFSGGRFCLQDTIISRDWPVLYRWIKNQRIKTSELSFLMKRILPLQIRQWIKKYKNQSNQPALLRPDFIKKHHLRERYDLYKNQFDDLPERYQAQYHGLFNAMWSEGFAEINRHYYEQGIELHSPYFNADLVQFILSIPINQIEQPLHYRHIQRNAMKALLPTKISERKSKTSFDALFQKGIFEKENSLFKAYLKNPLVVSKNIVDCGELQKTLSQLNEKNAYAVWMVFSLELWLKRFNY